MKKILFVLFIFIHVTSWSQLSQPGTPIGLKHQNLEHVPFEVMPPVDVASLIEEDLIFDTIRDIPWRFGENIYVDFNIGTHGVWTETPRGDKVWHLGISSPGAYSLNLTFDQYRLPPGAELYVYTPDGTQVLGAFTEQNNQDDLYFATTLLPGDALIIEYIEPAHAAFEGLLNLEIVTHAYRDPFAHARGFGHAGWCNLNVACEEADDWEDQVNSVVMLVTGSNGFCSGVLVNNTAYDATPYVLSANHCYRNPSTVIFWFNWQSPTCENPPSSPPHDALSGSISRARHAASDFWLLEINSEIPESYNPFFAGWNRTLEASLSEFITGIHHPRGDIKKFSYTNGGVQAASYLGGPGSGTTHWRITWSGGTTTEPGSSGSAIFDSEGRVLGQLHGGYAACGNTLPDWYGRFGISWNGGGTNATRLSNWLDPQNTDEMVLQGFSPFQSFYSVNTAVFPANSGTTTGRGDYLIADTVEITATPNDGFIFFNWTLDNEIFSEEAEYSFAMPNHHLNLTANFISTDQSHSLTFLVNDNQEAEIPDATITLNGIEKEPGDYIFDLTPGAYEYTVHRDCYSTVEGEIFISYDDINIDVTLDNLVGDANGDLVVNIIDIITIANYFVGHETGGFCFNNADINGDGEINLFDIMGIIEILAY